MTELLTTAQMRAIEQAAIDSGAVTGLELMERAGQGVVEAIFEEWPEFAKTAHRAVVLCGPGNNGGDGFVVARLLKELGWEVEVFLYGDAEKLPPDARVNYESWTALGDIRTLTFPTVTEQDEQAVSHSLYGGRKGERRLCIDALFGIGLSRPLSGLMPITRLFDSSDGMDSSEGLSTVAVDVPSGLSADTGEIIGGDERLAMFVDLTVTFHTQKRGHRIPPLSKAVGRLVVKDIGL